ncbi:MAG: DUF3048 domain-containing protein [Candidatus Promineifilaceae bacterium]
MRTKSRNLFLYIIFVLVLITLSACSEDAGQPEDEQQDPASQSETESQSGEEASPTAIFIAPTATIIGSGLGLPPTSTMSAPPSPTPLPITEVAEPTPLNPEEFDGVRNPLTGEPVEDAAQLERRPLAIKISNAPALWVRPQSGLSDADIVFEHITEGALTRFTMIVYGKTPPDVGPIRSARLIDLELPAMYDASLVYSGTSNGVGQKLFNTSHWSRVLRPHEAGYYRTGADKPFEHTLYANPATLWEVLDAKGLNSSPEFSTNMSFSETPPPGGKPASEIDIQYSTELVEWNYDPETGRYYRWAAGQPILDANYGEQVSAANVVIVTANHVQDQNICEQVTNGVCVALSVEAQIWGSGPVTIFRDGQRYDGTWERIDNGDMFTFYDANGEPIPLQIGNSWFQVMPTWYENPVTSVP